MEQQTIRIKYHSNEIEKLTYIDGKSDWIDLRSAEHVVLKKGEFKLIKLGVSMQLPADMRQLLYREVLPTRILESFRQTTWVL